jgi:hypothetical protein
MHARKNKNTCNSIMSVEFLSQWAGKSRALVNVDTVRGSEVDIRR